MTNNNPTDCTKCGKPHGKCFGHNRAGNPCGKPPMTNQRVCANHGGKSPQALAAAERRGVEREATKALESFGVPIVIDYQTALLQELHRTAGAVAWLGAIVADLEQQSLVWGVTREKTGGEDFGTTTEAKPSAWYVLWMDQRRHLVDVARECGRAKIDERRVQLAEDQGRLLAGVIQRILARLELSDVQAALVSTVVPEELRAIGDVTPGQVAS